MNEYIVKYTSYGRVFVENRTEKDFKTVFEILTNQHHVDEILEIRYDAERMEQKLILRKQQCKDNQ